jgi:hypothetical protein
METEETGEGEGSGNNAMGQQQGIHGLYIFGLLIATLLGGQWR